MTTSNLNNSELFSKKSLWDKQTDTFYKAGKHMPPLQIRYSRMALLHSQKTALKDQKSLAELH